MGGTGQVPAALAWDCSAEGLAPGLESALRSAATVYYRQTGRSLRVTSGRRTLYHQATLMAKFTRAQLEGMYCRDGYPSYIRELVTHREGHGTLTPADAYRILASRTEGYISSHLYGGAVDIDTTGLNVPLAKKLLSERGFRVFDEQSLGVHCLHATYRHAPVLIIRQ